MPFTSYSDGTIIFASQLNADNATSLDINTTTPQIIKATCTFPAITTTTVTANGQLILAGATVDSVKIINSGVSYAVLPTDRYVLCQTSGALAIGLPSGPATGRIICIKDSGGTASSGLITIQPAAGLIDGQSNYVISNNYGTVQLIYSGTKWVSVV
jgi:hypothetical protein